MPDYPAPALEAAAIVVARHRHTGPPVDSDREIAAGILDAAAPLLAEAWGLDPEPPSAAALRAYLRSRGWSERPPGEAGSLFDAPGGGEYVAVVHEGCGDRRALMAALNWVAKTEGRTLWQVARDIAPTGPATSTPVTG